MCTGKEKVAYADFTAKDLIKYYLYSQQSRLKTRQDSIILEDVRKNSFQKARVQ